MSRSPIGGSFGLAGLLALLLAMVSCAAAPEYGLKPPIKADVAELAPISLKVEVENFRWNYSAAGEALVVSGRVRNRSGAAQRPVFLYAILFDETGRAVGMGEARVRPEYLPNGAEGDFHLMVKTSRPRSGLKGPVRHVRLLTNARNE